MPIENDRLDQKSTKASLGRKNCKLCYELQDKKQMKTLGNVQNVKSPFVSSLIGIAFRSGRQQNVII